MLWRQCVTKQTDKKRTDRQFRTSRVCHPSQKQKRSNATHKPTHSCFTFAFAPTHEKTFTFEIIKKALNTFKKNLNK